MARMFNNTGALFFDDAVGGFNLPIKGAPHVLGIWLRNADTGAAHIPFWMGDRTVGVANAEDYTLFHPHDALGPIWWHLRSVSGGATLASAFFQTPLNTWQALIIEERASNDREMFISTGSLNVNTVAAVPDPTKFNRIAIGARLDTDGGLFYLGDIARVCLWKSAGLTAAQRAEFFAGKWPKVIRGDDLVYLADLRGGSLLEEISGRTLSIQAPEAAVVADPPGLQYTDPVTLRSTIPLDAIRVHLNADEFADTPFPYTVVDLTGVGADVTTTITGLFDPAIDIENAGTIETAIEVLIANGTISRVTMVSDYPAGGNFQIGELLTGGTSGATACYVGEAKGVLYFRSLTLEFIHNEIITGGNSGATWTTHLTAPNVTPEGIANPKAGDRFVARGQNWQVDTVDDEAVAGSHLIGAQRAVAPVV